MTTQIDWQRELDASFGDGEDVPVGHYLAVGHHAVRRRRATAVVAGLGAAAVVAGIAWAAAPGSAPRTSDLPVATQPPPSTSPSATASTSPPTTRVREMPWRKGDPPAKTGPDGLHLRPGAVVHERRDGLYPGKDTESVALDISYEDERWWMVLEWDEGGGAMSSSRPEDGLFATFDAYVRAEVANGGMTSEPALESDDAYTWGGLVNWSGGEPEVRPGVVLQQVVHDPAGSSHDSIGLVLKHQGTVTWMFITHARSGGSSTSEEADRSGWTTFGQWLSEQVALQAGEPGLRLVDLADDGSVSAAQPGVEVLDQRADPELPAYGTDSAEASAVALVSWHGERWFVLFVRLPDQDAVTTFAAVKADGAQTLDDFVAFAAARAGRGGLR